MGGRAGPVRHLRRAPGRPGSPADDLRPPGARAGAGRRPGPRHRAPDDGQAVRRAPGDAVYGVAPGSFAELAVAREDKLAAKPANVGFAEAAVVPISAGTALQALVDVGRVRAGQSVLVLGASGGVGSYAVQLAKAFGEEVTGVCSTAKVDFVRSLGADRVIDYTQEDWASSAGGFDLVLGIGGSRPIERLRRALTERGTVVFVGGEQGGSVTGLGRQLRGALLVSPVVPQRLALLVAKERGVAYQRLTGLIEAGDVTPTLDRSFPLREAAVAVRMLEQGRVRGKLAIAL